MSGKPTGVLILAILQLISALLWLVAGYLAIQTVLFMLIGVIFLIVGIIGLILFYGLYTTKGWAWFWTLIINLLGVLGGLLGWEQLLNLSNLGQLGGFIVSLIIVIYLLLPSTRAAFK